MNQKTINTILYYRVSTDEQGAGYSPEHQKESLLRYCEINNLHVVGMYFDDCSGKTFKRPEWEKMELYIKTNKRSIDKVLFMKWDRFSRSVSLAHQKIDLFTYKYGVELNAVEQPLDHSIPENLLMLSNYLALSEIERRRIAQRTTDGIYQARKEGYFTNMAPYGYDNVKIGKKIGRKQRTSLKPNEKSSFIKMAFEEVAKGLEPVDVIRKKLIKKGFKMGSSNFAIMLMKVTYIGKIFVPEYKGEPSFLSEGKHEAIVSEALFYKVQEVLLGKKGLKNLPKKLNENFPIRGYLTCEICGSNITGSPSRGRSKVYYYYHCRNKCKVRVSVKKVHDWFDNILNQIKISESVKDLYQEILIDTVAKEEGSKEEQIKSLLKQKEDINERITNIEDQLSSRSISSESFNNMNTRYQESLREVRFKIESLNSKENSIEDDIKSAMTFLLEIKGIFNNADMNDKQIILGSIFKENLILSKNDCRTTKLNEVIALLYRNNKGLDDTKKRKAVKNDSFSALVPKVGTQPYYLNTPKIHPIAIHR